ncbi:DUF3383 family protein [Limnohabitans sp.]|uniref:DUF3383 family protein n=1 Tax=Limnohabitans sp. TaxID=1907725 RepID=UPI00286ECE84|nr:DUF3383 family protein [Limnohabitans sp.]
MSIRMSRYVAITSGVGAGTTVNQRALIGRLFTTNPLVPPQTVLEFTDLASVGAYFGTTAEEYLRASLYFGWVSKSIKKAKKISFYRWMQTAATPQIFGSTSVAPSLAQLTALTAATLTISLDGVANNATAINLSGAANLAAVATIIQTAIRASGGANWSAATCTFNATLNEFVIGSGSGTALSVAAGTLASYIGMDAPNKPILSNGGAAESLTTCMTNSANLSTNFGSFLFLPALSVAQQTELAIWNNAQNIMYQQMVRCMTTEAAAYNAALANYSGVCLTLYSAALTTEYPEMVPMIQTAATDYNAINGTSNYMFQQFPLTPLVTTDTDANTYDALSVNYMGQTQTAGQYLSFYQRGKMLGPSTAPLDMHTYANEMWFKDAMQSSFMTLMLSMPKVSVNKAGRSLLIAQAMSVIAQALNNGTISPNKPLTQTQQSYITTVTGDETAYRQVGGIGYWLDVQFQQFTTPSNTTEWQAVYTCIYAKDDVVRAVSGTHILI